MNLSQETAKHLRQVYFGGNWTSVHLKDQLSDVSLEEAMTQVGSLNTIAKLAYHIQYYVKAILQVMQGGPLDAHDKYSFDLPAIQNEEEWKTFLNNMWVDAEVLASRIEQFPEAKLSDFFWEEKYGTYLRNILGLIEHTHYHLGQVSIIKKMIRVDKVSIA
jgi:uncharacterized damage-inducible protein DinB